MSEHFVCPFCGSNKINKKEINNYLCYNCGLAFSYKDKKLNMSKTEISKEVFFSSIFDALKEVTEEKIADDVKEKIISIFSKNITTYY